MRQFTLIAFIGCVLCVACNHNGNNTASVKDFIPGTYVKEIKNEYAIACDTLFIKCIDGNNFLIVNHTAFQPIRNGKLLPVKYTESSMKALYDEASQNLNEQRLGKIFSFDPENNRLFAGAHPYYKIKY